MIFENSQGIVIMLFSLTCLSVIVVALGCSPITTTTQDKYCNADFVFEAEVIKLLNGDEVDNFLISDYEYKIEITTIYKGKGELEQINSNTIFGDGPSYSCGAQKLANETKYLIYAYNNTDPLRMVLGEYINMVHLDDDDIKIMSMFDCSCKFNLPWGNNPPLPTTDDQCHMPKNACTTNVYCRRDQSSLKCVPGILGNC